ncbi:hypothetical protein Tco_0600813, partial [Tanacetum coccineum]
MVDKVIDSGNNKGTQEGNVGHTPFSSTADPNIVTSEPSRKSVNFRTLIAPAGNRADVAISLESIRDISERYANT